MSPASAKVSGEFGCRVTSERMMKTTKALGISEFSDTNRDLKTVREEADITNERTDMTKASKGNRFSVLFKDGASVTNSFTVQDMKSVDSKMRNDRNEFDYDNLARGTEAERVLSARKEDKEIELKNFDSNY